MNPKDIICFFYPQDTMLRRLLIRHSERVRDKALLIARENKDKHPDLKLIARGAMLHDIGIGKCRAQSIYCLGVEPYIRHGVLGAEMLRNFGKEYGIDMEPYARICERHTGSGLSAEEIKRQGLPLPAKDLVPETTEEKIICLADKFFSKSGDGKEKQLREIEHGMEKFGGPPLERFLDMAKDFQLRKAGRVLQPFTLACILIAIDTPLAGITSCPCLAGKLFLYLKAAFLLLFLIRALIRNYEMRLTRIDVWFYEIVFLLIVGLETFVH